MTDGLIVALLKKKAFDPSTIITAGYTSTDVFGQTFEKLGYFKIKNILTSSNNILFERVILAANDSLMVIPECNIRLLDGIDVYQHTYIYDILSDGTKKIVGKRGRKPKIDNILG